MYGMVQEGTSKGLKKNVKNNFKAKKRKHPFSTSETKPEIVTSIM